MPNILTRIASFFRGSTRSYEAASGGRRFHKQPIISNPALAMQTARQPISHRARAVVANDPLAASGVEVYVNAIVGTGMKAQSTHPDADKRTAYNLAFERWCNRADADGQLDFYGLQSLMCKKTIIDGDAFAVMITTPENELRLRVIDADMVASDLQRPVGAGQVVGGVEFDATGRRVAYHIREQDQNGQLLSTRLKTIRVPVEDVVHLHRIETPGQTRGISWLTPVLPRISDLSGWRDATLVRQKTAAMFTGFVTTTDGMGVEQQADGLNAASLEPGAMFVLPEGQTVDFTDPPSVGVEVMSFAQFTVHEIAAGLGVPYALLSGDLGQATYGSARIGAIGFNRRVEALQHGMLAFQMLRPVFERWAMLETLSGRISGQVEQAIGATFVPAKTNWLDPKSDALAEAIAIQAGLMSRRDALAARGLDIEAVDATIAADNARAEALGLTFGPPANDNPPTAASAA